MYSIARSETSIKILEYIANYYCHRIRCEQLDSIDPAELLLNLEQNNRLFASEKEGLAQFMRCCKAIVYPKDDTSFKMNAILRELSAGSDVEYPEKELSTNREQNEAFLSLFLRLKYK